MINVQNKNIPTINLEKQSKRKTKNMFAMIT